MINQYNPQRYRYGTVNGRSVKVGTVPVGTITTYDGQKVIVEAWFNREYTAARKVDGKYVNTFIRGGHLALVRRLHDGKQFRLAEQFLMDNDD